MVDCPGCKQAAVALYCRDCINARLQDHAQKRNQFRQSLERARSTAASLLPTVRQESAVKADKWHLAVRVKEARHASQLDRTSNEDHKQRLVKRRSNLVNARLRLTALVSPSSANGSLSSMHAQLDSLTARHAVLTSTLAASRSLLSKELLNLSLQSSSDPFLPSSHSLFALALPPLSLLPTLSPKTLVALLTHLSNITRLVAMYHSLVLPFTPFSSLSAPGIPGLRTCRILSVPADARDGGQPDVTETAPRTVSIVKPASEKKGHPDELDDLFDAAAAVIVNVAFLAGVAIDVAISTNASAADVIEDLGTMLEKAGEGIGRTDVRWLDVRQSLKTHSKGIARRKYQDTRNDDEDWVEV